MIEAVGNERNVGRIPSVDPARALAARSATVIDLRSPSEWAHDHVPRSHNVPLFDDEERALVGTLYKQVSPDRAFEEGRKLVRRRIHALVAKIAELARWNVAPSDLDARVVALTSGGLERMSQELCSAAAEHDSEASVVFHCWRGGLRSRSVVALVRGLGLERALLLEGGYKSYRAHVLAELANASLPPVYVLRGLTGVGKTLVLRELERLLPRATIDLEALAGHRSSLLGKVGLEPCSQKMFESRLMARLREGLRDFAVFEGESRKVGDIILPNCVWKPLSAGVDIELTADVERRVAVLESDYLASAASRRELAEQLAVLEERMQREEGAPNLCAMLARGEEHALARLLLEQHYDPRYRHGQQGRRYALSVDASDPARAAREIACWIEVRTEHR